MSFVISAFSSWIVPKILLVLFEQKAARTLELLYPHNFALLNYTSLSLLRAYGLLLISMMIITRA